MKKIGRYIAIFLASGLISAGLVVTSFSFNNAEKKENSILGTQTGVVFTSPKINESHIEYLPLNSENNEFFASQFGRLSSGFFAREGENMNIENSVMRDKNTITVAPMKGIVSWYDPFENYILTDTDKNFSVEQITNGSLYFSFDKNDKTITLYSIDMVAKLSFFFEGTEKTNMFLFPGMYLKFDPEQNKNMQNADLLRIIQIQQGSPKNTAIIFMNPRISGTSIFIPYVLRGDKNSEMLFNLLKVDSKAKMSTADALKEYEKMNKNTFVSSTEGIVNPTKKMYKILGELQILLSRSVNGQVNSDDFRKQAQEIIDKSQEFSLGNMSKEMLEQFLIDGRFVLFDENSNNNYQQIYDETASILGIQPTTSKGKMFQSLSNNFFRNIVRENASTTDELIDTAIYTLSNTIAQSKDEISTKDYFDISLYSFLLLRVLPNQQETENLDDNKSLITAFYKTILDRKILEDKTLYGLYAMIFDATQRYISGMEDKNQAQIAMITDFYHPMLSLLVKSLYQNYTTLKDGDIILRENFIERGVPKIAQNHSEMSMYITNIYTVINTIFEQRIKNISDSGTLETKREMQKNLRLLEGFIRIIQSDYSTEYLKNPYIAENNSFLPKFDNQSGNLVKKNTEKPAVVEPPRENPSLENNSERIAKILSNIAGITVGKENISLQSGFIYNISTTHQEKKIQFAFDASQNTVSNLKIESNITMQFSDTFLVTGLRDIVTKISLYESHIEKIRLNNKIEIIKNVSMNYSQKRIQIGSQFFPIPN